MRKENSVIEMEIFMICVYVGDFVKDKADRRGIFYFNNDDRYEGEFKKDAREGKGILCFEDWNRMMGDYIKDIPVGKQVIFRKNSDITQKIFQR